MRTNAGMGIIIKQKKKRIKEDNSGLTIKNIIHIMAPRRKRKFLTSINRIVQNSLCGAYFERCNRFGGGSEIYCYSYEWCPSLADVRKMKNAFHRIRVNYTEEELEYFRIMKELEEEQIRLDQKEAS